MGGLWYGDVSGVVFLGLARTCPNEDFYIADITAGKADRSIIPSNLSITSPILRKIPLPFFSTYKLTYPSNYFDDARMDTLLDVVSPDIVVKIFREIKRCLKPNGCLTIVDDVFHRSSTIFSARLSGFKQESIMGTQEIIQSGYPLSEQSLAFKHFRHDLFLLKLRKS